MWIMHENSPRRAYKAEETETKAGHSGPAYEKREKKRGKEELLWVVDRQLKGGGGVTQGEDLSRGPQKRTPGVEPQERTPLVPPCALRKRHYTFTIPSFTDNTEEIQLLTCWDLQTYMICLIQYTVRVRIARSSWGVTDEE